MKKNTKVLLTQKWWKENKAKTLKDKGGLGKVLGAFESAYKLAFAAKGTEQFKRLKVALKLCGALDVAAGKNAKACISKIHADTKHVLENSFLSEVADHRKRLLNVQKELVIKIAKMKITDVIKDKSYLVQYMAMAKKRLNQENINFILASKKKNAAVYNEYIKVGSPQEINIDHRLRAEFDTAFANGDIGNAPWSKAANICVGLIDLSDMGSNFTKHILGG